MADTQQAIAASVDKVARRAHPVWHRSFYHLYTLLGGAPAHLRYLVRRLRQRAPHATLITGLWGQGDPVLNDAHAALLGEAKKVLRDLVQQILLGDRERRQTRTLGLFVGHRHAVGGDDLHDARLVDAEPARHARQGLVEADVGRVEVGLRVDRSEVGDD